MLYFKHSELVDNYRVSLKTVHNWIAAAKQGKLDLTLHEQGGRTYIANKPSNLIVLRKLSDKGKKYRNTLHHKVITPKPEFYDLYSRRQILDIIHNLDIHREIPRQYNYFNGGADNWDKWVKRLEKEKTANYYNGTVGLLHDNLSKIDLLIQDHTRINVIDIGVGNAMPARELLTHLLDRGILNRYIALDISGEMLDIAERNIHEWFGDKIKFEGHIRDIGHERFDDILVDDMLGEHAEHTLNLALLLGATPANFRSPLSVVRTIYSSIGQDDLLIYTMKPDSDTSRGYFDFSLTPDSKGLSSYNAMIEMLNINDSLYDIEMGFDEQKHMRYVRIKLRTALSIEFKFENGVHPVHLEKGDTILLLRVWHKNPIEIISDFEQVGFTLLHSSLTKDRQYLMTISGVNVKAED